MREVGSRGNRNPRKPLRVLDCWAGALRGPVAARHLVHSP